MKIRIKNWKGYTRGIIGVVFTVIVLLAFLTIVVFIGRARGAVVGGGELLKCELELKAKHEANENIDAMIDAGQGVGGAMIEKGESMGLTSMLASMGAMGAIGTGIYATAVVGTGGLAAIPLALAFIGIAMAASITQDILEGVGSALTDFFGQIGETLHQSIEHCSGYIERECSGSAYYVGVCVYGRAAESFYGFGGWRGYAITDRPVYVIPVNVSGAETIQLDGADLCSDLDTIAENGRWDCNDVGGGSWKWERTQGTLGQSQYPAGHLEKSATGCKGNWKCRTSETSMTDHEKIWCSSGHPDYYCECEHSFSVEMIGGDTCNVTITAVDETTATISMVYLCQDKTPEKTTFCKCFADEGEGHSTSNGLPNNILAVSRARYPDHGAYFGCGKEPRMEIKNSSGTKEKIKEDMIEWNAETLEDGKDYTLETRICDDVNGKQKICINSS